MSERTVPGHVDSTGKLIERLARVATHPVLMKGRLMCDPVPREYYVSPSLLREFRCVSGCTACCLPFTLDFTPEEFWEPEVWSQDILEMTEDVFYSRDIEVNDKKFEVLTYDQYKDDQCPFLKPVREDGNLGCSFWPQQPLECAAAPNLLMTTRGPGVSMLMKRPFGRGWAWKDKPQCEFDPVVDRIEKIPDEFDLSHEISLLERYLKWAEHLEITTVLPEMIDCLKDFPAALRESNLRSVRVA